MERDSLIFITGAGAPGWLSIKRAITQLNKSLSEYEFYTPIGWDCDPSIPWSEHIVPKGDSPSYKENVLRIIEQYPKQLDKYILPITDPELIPLANMKEDLSTLNCKVLSSEASELEKALNKETLYNLLPEVSPKVIDIKDLKDLWLGKPFVKLKAGHGGRGTKMVVSQGDWEDGFTKMKPVDFGSIITLSQVGLLISNGVELVIVENLPGTEYSIDCIMSDIGEVLFYGVREREVIKHGICYQAKFIVDTGEFKALIDQVTSKIKLKYNINIQVKRDINGALKLLEINPRISGSAESFNLTGYTVLDEGLRVGLNLQRKLDVLTPPKYFTEKAYRTTEFRDVFEIFQM